MPEKRNIDWKNYSANYVAIAIFAVLVVPIFTLTQFGLNPTISGPVGDTVGGMTAPIIGLISAILIYRSFRAQIEANDSQRNENNFQYLNEELEKFKNEIKNYTIDLDGMYYIGTNALKTIGPLVPSHYPGGTNANTDCIELLNKFRYLTLTIENRLDEIKLLKLQGDFKKVLENKYWLFYKEYLYLELGAILNWNPTKALKHLNRTEKAEFKRSELFQLSIEIKARVETLLQKFEEMKKEV